MVHKDCFAYHKSAGGVESCKALKTMQCYKCKFYKTEKQVKNTDGKEE